MASNSVASEGTKAVGKARAGDGRGEVVLGVEGVVTVSFTCSQPRGEPSAGLLFLLTVSTEIGREPLSLSDWLGASEVWYSVSSSLSRCESSRAFFICCSALLGSISAQSSSAKENRRVKPSFSNSGDSAFLGYCPSVTPLMVIEVDNNQL